MQYRLILIFKRVNLKAHFLISSRPKTVTVKLKGDSAAIDRKLPIINKRKNGKVTQS